MQDDAPPPSVTPTAAWLAEQEAKQAAYAARRRAWTGAARGIAPEAPPVEEAVPPLPEPPLAGEEKAPSAPRRPRGIVHDTRQDRFGF